MFASLFNRKARIQCPFCLKGIELAKGETTCSAPDCGQPLDRQYLKDYPNALPFFVPLIGWTNVGKTVFIQSLTLILEHIKRTWPEYYNNPLTEFTLATKREVLAAFAANRLPDSTKMGVKEAFVMQLMNMPLWGSRTLVVRDCAGENFAALKYHPDQARFAVGAGTIFLMVSLTDLLEAEDRGDKQLMSFDDLMPSYISTLHEYNVDPLRQRRNVVVVLSKADEIKDLPANLDDYLNDDPVWPTINPRGRAGHREPMDLEAYFERLERVSDEIGEWLNHKGLGLGMVRMARANKIQLRFTMISSLGRKPVGTEDGAARDQGKLLEQWDPHRVIDPFLLALDFESR